METDDTPMPAVNDAQETDTSQAIDPTSHEGCEEMGVTGSDPASYSASNDDDAETAILPEAAALRFDPAVEISAVLKSLEALRTVSNPTMR